MEAEEMPTDVPAPDAGGTPAPDAPPPDAPPPEAPTAPVVEKEPSSPARAALIQVAITAYIEPTTSLSNILVNNVDDINIHNSDAVLHDIQRRLPATANRHFNKNFGKGSNKGVEEGEKVELVKLAWRAMFEKSQVEINPEIRKKFEDVTVENAEQAYDTLSLALSYNTEQLD